ncbi:hypothetical protein ACNQGB_04340 [Flavobacterium sp. XS1P32]|uniref:hypothetical protein n=1 Tax=Flavobacterium sp. XS1P32 TaxID=3401726 RepID=UPI003AABBA01
MTGKQLEKILKNQLTDYFKEKNYKFSHEYENTYYTKKESLYDIKLEVQSKSSSIGYADFNLTFWNIEDIILEIGLPNRTLKRMLEIYKNFTTIQDIGVRTIVKYDKLNPIETEADCIEYCQRIVNYMENEGAQFIEKYSYLPNVLSEMDRLESEGKYWNEILTGMAEHRFRGLIISKLCNDKRFFVKQEMLDAKFSTIPLLVNNGWLPYYEKLKERLKTVEPIYNI